MTRSARPWAFRVGVAFLLLYAAFVAVAGAVARSPVVAADPALLRTMVLAAAGFLVALIVFLSGRTLRRRRGRAGRVIGLVAAVGGAYFAYMAVSAPAPGAIRADHFVLALYALLTILHALCFRGRHDDGALYTGAVAGAVVVALASEALQWWAPDQIGSLADIWVELSGALVGVAFAAAVLYLGDVPLSLSPRGWRTTLRIAAAATLAVALFIDVVHLVRPLVLSDIGATVRSRFSARELAGLAANWRPPPPLATWLAAVRRGEDFYLAEASWHAERRAGYLEAERLAAAYQTQRVLEELYRPFLDYGLAPTLDDEARARLAEMAPEARRLPIDLGPYELVTAIDRLTLWLFAIAITSGLLLAAEAVALSGAS